MVLFYAAPFNFVLFNFVLFCSIPSSNLACWIMMVMATRSLLPGTPCFLRSYAIYIHSNAFVASHSIAVYHE